MKLKEITEAQKQNYLSQANSILANYDEMIKNINGKLAKFGLIHYQQTKNVLNKEYAIKQKTELEADIKATNTSTLVQIIAKLNEVKGKYITELSSVEASKDDLNLSMIEKELRVMNDGELRAYHEENYFDANICRLVNIEYKARNGHKDGNTAMSNISLPGYEVSDDITKKIDKQIMIVESLRQITGSQCCLQVPTGEGEFKPVMISWRTIFSKVEERGSLGFNKVCLADFINI